MKYPQERADKARLIQRIKILAEENRKLKVENNKLKRKTT